MHAVWLLLTEIGIRGQGRHRLLQRSIELRLGHPQRITLGNIFIPTPYRLQQSWIVAF